MALQTALAVINGRKDCRVRVLFDTGNHRSFITAKAVGKLHIRPVRNESLGIKCFGNEETKTAVRDVVELSLNNINGVKSIQIEAFVVDNISTISNVHAEIVKKGFPHLIDIWFSDVCRSEEKLEIDCLIGADYL